VIVSTITFTVGCIDARLVCRKATSGREGREAGYSSGHWIWSE
jgi:hypothetical protein